MEKYQVLSGTELFSGLEMKELTAMLPCLGLRTKQCSKGDYIVRYGDIVSEVGAVLSGSADVVREDRIGNRYFVEELEEGSLFGETFVCANVVSAPTSVIAKEKCDVLFFNFNRLISCCSNCCMFHAKVVANLLKLMARKNMNLSEKVQIMEKRTTRDKLASYLLIQMERQATQEFHIPLSRGELADYLAVDRSAMSRELGRLRDEGILDFTRNQFRILDVQKLAM